MLLVGLRISFAAWFNSWPSTHILSWGGGGEATMKRVLTENICKRAQYDLPRPRSGNDGPGALYAPPGDLRYPRRQSIAQWILSLNFCHGS